MSFRNLSVKERIKLLVDTLDGDKRVNERLSESENADVMLDILVEFSNSMDLELNRDDLRKNPPTRDWIWWKNKEALVKLGDDSLRYQQDRSSKTRWDSWTISFFKFIRIWK